MSERDVWPGFTLSTASYVCSLLDPWLVEELGLHDAAFRITAKIRTRLRPCSTGVRSCSAPIARQRARDRRLRTARRRRLRCVCRTNRPARPRALRFVFRRRAAVRPLRRRNPSRAARFGSGARRAVYCNARSASGARERRFDRHLSRTARSRHRTTCWRTTSPAGSWARRVVGVRARRHGIGFAGHGSRRYGARRRDLCRHGRHGDRDRNVRACGVRLSTSGRYAPMRSSSNAHPRTTFLDLLDAGCARSGVRRSRRKLAQRRPLAESQPRARRVARLHVPPGNESAIASSCDHSRRTDDRLFAESLRGCAGRPARARSR